MLYPKPVIFGMGIVGDSVFLSTVYSVVFIFTSCSTAVDAALRPYKGTLEIEESVTVTVR